MNSTLLLVLLMLMKKLWRVIIIVAFEEEVAVFVRGRKSWDLATGGVLNQWRDVPVPYAAPQMKKTNKPFNFLLFSGTSSILI